MTVIVGIVGRDGRVHMGGDKLGSADGRKAVYDSPKVFKQGKLIIGYSGSNAVGDQLHHCLNNPDDPLTMIPEENREFEGVEFEEQDNETLQGYLDGKKFLVRKVIPIIKYVLKEAGVMGIERETKTPCMDASALIGYANKLYLFQSDFSLLEVSEGIEAIGDGEDTARGYLQNAQKRGGGKLQNRSQEKIRDVIAATIVATSTKIQAVSSESIVLTLEADRSRYKIKQILLEREKEKLEAIKNGKKKSKKPEEKIETTSSTDQLTLPNIDETAIKVTGAGKGGDIVSDIPDQGPSEANA